MERLFSGIFPLRTVRVEDHVPLRRIRLKRGKSIFISDEMNLTQKELDSVLEIAHGMTDLIDLEKLYTSYCQGLWENPLVYTPGQYWGNVAYSAMERHLEATGRNEFQLPERVRAEINTDIHLVTDFIDDLIKGKVIKPKFHYVHKKDKDRTIIGVCAGAEFAKEWISNGIAVIGTAMNEYPQLFRQEGKMIK